jgi:hypothetical protein
VDGHRSTWPQTISKGDRVPFDLLLPLHLRKARWKVKIREKETREPPHVTILRGTKACRIDLRNGEFMDRKPDPAEVPDELVDFIKSEENWQRLCDEWDEKYPANPVRHQEDTTGE